MTNLSTFKIQKTYKMYENNSKICTNCTKNVVWWDYNLMIIKTKL